MFQLLDNKLSANLSSRFSGKAVGFAVTGNIRSRTEACGSCPAGTVGNRSQLGTSNSGHL